MKKIKLIIVWLVSFLIFFGATNVTSMLLRLPCQTSPMVFKQDGTIGDSGEWRDSMCPVAGGFLGASWKFTPAVNALRLVILYIVPILGASGVVYIVKKRKSRKDSTIQQ